MAETFTVHFDGYVPLCQRKLAQLHRLAGREERSSTAPSVTTKLRVPPNPLSGEEQ
jgi:hypothetical protein